MFTLQYFCCHSSRSWQFTTLHSFATLLSLDFYQKYKHYKIQIQHRNIPLYSVTILTEAAPQRHVNTTLAKSHKFHYLTLVKFSKKPRRGLKLPIALSISAIFGFTFSNQVLTPDIYGAHW